MQLLSALFFVMSLVAMEEELKTISPQEQAESWLISIHDYPVAPHVPNAKHKNLKLIESRNMWRKGMQSRLGDAINKGDTTQLLQLFNNITVTSMQEIMQELSDMQTNHTQVNKKLLCAQVGSVIFGLAGMGFLSYLTYASH